MSDLLLHAEYCSKMAGTGRHYLNALTDRANETLQASVGIPDPDVSVVIRSRNERERLEGLLQDLRSQLFDGQVEILVVDSGSTDGTRELAQEYGASIVPIDQSTYSHPGALNKGFERASFPYVFTFVGHSNLTNLVALRGLSRWTSQPNFAGAYGPAALPDDNATVWERRAARGIRLQDRLAPAAPVDGMQRGIMVTHRAVYARDAWVDLGGFDERYGAGGEDLDMARRMLESGMTIVREPVLSIYHSHHLGMLATRLQNLEYRRLREGPSDFDPRRLSYRKDLQLSE